jgi:hypothetical protein
VLHCIGENHIGLSAGSAKRAWVNRKMCVQDKKG